MAKLHLTIFVLLSSHAYASVAEAQPSNGDCRTKHELTVHGRRYVSCNNELFVFTDAGDASKLLERRRATTDIRDLLERDGDVFVELHEVTLRPASSLQLMDTIAEGTIEIPGLEPTASSRRRVGKVISTEVDSLVVTLGKQDGVKEGDHVAIVEYADEEIAGEQVRTERVRVVGEIIEVAPEHARVRLGFGEFVSVGDVAKVTEAATTARLVARPHPTGLFLSLGLRPFLPINDDLAFATLGDFDATYRFDLPIFVRARVGAFGGVVSKQTKQSIFDAWVDVGFDHRLFSLGLGVGVLRNPDDSDSGTAVRSTRFRPTVVQSARFGSVDGLNVAVTTRAMIRDGAVEFGAVSSQFAAPIHRRIALILRGGGGREAAYGFGEAGARFVVRGNGKSGTLSVTPAVGYASIRVRDRGVLNYVGGPSLSVGVEWRP